MIVTNFTSAPNLPRREILFNSQCFAFVYCLFEG